MMFWFLLGFPKMVCSLWLDFVCANLRSLREIKLSETMFIDRLLF